MTPFERRHEPRSWFHGRLNLEQQKKRAKALLGALRAGDPAGQERFVKSHPEADRRTAHSAKLADAQLVIARENGFSSWPRMKAHIEKLTLAHRAIQAGRPVMPDTADTCHIRCGSDIAHGLKLAGFAGSFIEFSDPFCQGPLCDVPLPEFIELRADFISRAYGEPKPRTLTELRSQYRMLGQLGDYERIVLWFEHDSYDQLILAFLLAHFHTHGVQAPVDLICVDHVPGVPHFQGLGQLSPELLLWLWDNARRPVTAAHLNIGRAIWSRLLSRAPSELTALGQIPAEPLAFAARALSRHLQELPQAENELSLTQSLILGIARDSGPVQMGQVFGKLMREWEPLPFLGDLMFYYVLRDLNNCRAPLFTVTAPSQDTPWPAREIEITPRGAAILDGDKRYLGDYLGERWVGNIRISATDAVPHWHDEGGQVIVS